MNYYKNGSYYNVRPEYCGSKVIVAIDSSKTNSGMFVADEYGDILDDYEISGDSTDDIYWQTEEQRKFLRVLFHGSTVLFGGIEDVITKKDSRGMQEHYSRLVITLVYASFISTFQDDFGCTLEPINNWTWKADILPEEFRKAKYDKGSLAYHQAIRSKYAHRKDDITDAWCILQHILKKHNVTKAIPVTNDIEDMSPCKYAICSSGMNTTTYTEFKYNKELTFQQNIAFLSNRIESSNSVNFFKVPITVIDIKDIYTRCIGVFLREEREVKVMVYRGD